MPEAAIAMVSLSEEARKAEIEQSRKTAQAWVRELKIADIEADAIIDYREGESIASSILKETRRTSGLIALAGESGELESRLLGSVTRQILRESPNPVWVIHPSRFHAKWPLTRSA